jgi:hypothetical protein
MSRMKKLRPVVTNRLFATNDYGSENKKITVNTQ